MMAKIDMVCPRYSETHGVIRNSHSASGASYSACWDNAVIEHFWGYLKHEWLLLVPQPTRSYMKQDAAAYIRLFHQLTGQPASHFDTRVSGDDSRDASSAGRAAAGVQASMTWLRLATCSPSCSLSEVCLPVAAAMDFKSLAQHSHRISCSQPVDYREPLSASDIKSAVAFFRISFSISRRWTFSSFLATRAVRASEEAEWAFSPGVQVAAYSPSG